MPLIRRRRRGSRLAKSAPFRPTGTFPRFAGEGFEPHHRRVSFPPLRKEELKSGHHRVPLPLRSGGRCRRRKGALLMHRTIESNWIARS